MSKILICTNHSYMLYQFRKELIENLLIHNDVILSMPFVGHETELKDMGCKCIETKINRRGINALSDLKLLKTYNKIIKEEKPDKVITYSIKPNIYMGYICGKMKIPFFANVQGLGSAFQNKILGFIVSLMYKISFRNSKVVFFENESNAEEFVKRKIISPEKQRVLKGAGINLNHYTYKSYPQNDTFNFLFVGRIMKEKGIDELIVSAKKLKEEYKDKFILNIVGFFEEEYSSIVRQLHENNIIKYHGFHNDVRPFYECADCVVLPSYHEGMSNVLLEAAATGRPIITTDIPGCRETVCNNETGLLCEPYDSISLYKAMKSFMSLTKKQRELMGRKGRLKMEKEFDKQQVINDTVNNIFSFNNFN